MKELLAADRALEEDAGLAAADNLDYMAARPDHALAVEAGCNLAARSGCKLPVEADCKLPLEAGCKLPVEAGCNLAVEAGCNLAAKVLTEGNAVLVGRTFPTAGWWTPAFADQLRSHGNDCGSTDNMYNRSMPRRK